MRRKVSGVVPFEKWMEYTFSLIYMEIDKTYAGKKPTRTTIWHLEDETRPTQALCGLILHDRCVSVSPALAMFGTPCGTCRNIVAEWLTVGVQRDREARWRALLRLDTIFRKKVHEVVRPEFFNANYVAANDPENESTTAKASSSRKEKVT
jgi:hypothetical protein